MFAVVVAAAVAMFAVVVAAAAAMFAVVVAAAAAMAPSWAMAWTPEQAPSWADVVTLLTVFQLKVWTRCSCT
jgi:hypothetical protein